MCTKLYTDIIVSAELYNFVKIYRKTSIEENPVMSIEELIRSQNDYKHFGGMGYVITGNKIDWNKNDYIEYFSKFSECFIPLDYLIKDKFSVNISFFNKEKISEISKEDIWDKLLLHSYSLNTLSILGLNE